MKQRGRGGLLVLQGARAICISFSSDFHPRQLILMTINDENLVKMNEMK
jgi:hypothetical protein